MPRKRQAHRAVRGFLALARSARSAPSLKPRIDDLERLLPEHFMAEERPGGFLDRIGAAGGSGPDVSAKLRQQHLSLAETLDDLLGGWQSRAEADNLARARAFAEELAQHEAIEARFDNVPSMLGHAGKEVG